MNTESPNNFANRIITECSKEQKVFCVDTMDQTLSFDQLKTHVEQVAGVLHHQKKITGMRRIGIFLDDSVQWPVVFLACLYIGANPLLLYRNMGREDTLDLCHKADCNVVICHDNDQFPGFDTIRLSDLMESDKQPAPPCYDWHDDEPCWWTLSSGSTNQNKLIVHKHGSFDGLYQASNNLVGITYSDRVLMTGKMSFPWGLSYMLWCLFNKATLHVIHTAPAPTIAANIINRYDITKFMVTPFLLNKMCDKLQQQLPEHTKIYVSGEPLTTLLRQKAKRAFNKRIHDAYGLSEVFACVAIQADDCVSDNMGNVGEGIEYKLIDKQGKQCAPGIPGELYIKSPAQALFYWKSHDMTKKTFLGDWVKTGDLVVEKDKKKLVFLGRLSTFIKVKNSFVNPDQIEAVINDEPGVDECIVKCLSHEGIQQLYADIKPTTDDFDVKLLKQSLSTKLKPTHMPRSFRLVNHIPKTVNLKKKRHKIETKTQ